MGLIFNRKKKDLLSEEVLALLREIMAVSRKQAEVAEAMAFSLKQLGMIYVEQPDPESWVSENDHTLLKEMLEREAQKNAREFAGPEES